MMDPGVISKEKIRYDACVLKDDTLTPKGQVTAQSIQEGKYAIFIHNGAYHTMEDLYNAVFLKWLPESKEDLDDSSPTFCKYFNREQIMEDPEKLITELYIPLK